MSPSRISAKIACVFVPLLVFCFSLVLVRYHQNATDFIYERNIDTLRLALSFDLAIRDYIGTRVRPEIEERVGPNRFLPETMSSSFAARAIFDEVASSFPKMMLKFSSRRPRNPKNLATPAEDKALAFFETHPQASSWQGEIQVQGKPYFALFSPRRMSEACMQCHSDPSLAPAELLARYGREAGFFYHQGQLMATDTVAISQEEIDRQLHHQAVEGVVMMAIATLGILVGIFWGLDWLVLSRIARISKHFSAISEQGDGAEIKPLEVAGHDEIDVMARSFNRLAERLAAASQAKEEEAQSRLKANELLRAEVEERRRAEDNLHELSVRQEEIIHQRTQELEAQHASLQAAHDNLKSAQSQLLQREKMASIGQLAAGVAHEINNPVGFIHSNLSTLSKYVARFEEYIAAQEAVSLKLPESDRRELAALAKRLKLDYVTEDARQLVRECLEGTERVKEIVTNLKNFSRVDHKELQAANLNNCLEETLRIVWNELKYKATVVKDYGELPETFCYPQQLNQVFVNILVNAAQAIAEKGEIRIATRAEAGTITVAISDNGPGIPEEIRSRLFEPFFTTKEVGKGTGLGLSISYDIVKKHGGEIEVESELGRGTTFFVRLPVRARGAA